MSKRLLIGSSSAPDRGSGINAYVNQIAGALAAAGHEIVYAAPASEAANTSCDYEHFPLGPHLAPAEAATQLLDLLYSRRFDLIINNDNPFLQMIAPLANTVFASVGHMSRTNVARLACHNHAWVDYIVAISADMQNRFVQRFRIPTDRVPIIYNGVADVCAEDLPRRAHETRLKLIYAGGNDRNKGADLLLRALLQPQWAAAAYELDWFGYMDDGLKHKLETLRHVRVHGRAPREIFLRHLADADVFLLPSRTEGCPMAMLEAMSYGVIPLASNGIGAMQRLIIHGTEGYICRLDDWSQSMFHCLHRLRDPRLRELFRKNTYQRFHMDFTAANTAARLVALAEVPSVDRRSPPDRIQLLRWHRPTIKGSNKAPLVDRVCIKAGLLRTAGMFAHKDR